MRASPLLHLGRARRTSRLTGTIQERKDILECIVVHKLLTKSVVFFLWRRLHIQTPQLIKVMLLFNLPLLAVFVDLLDVDFLLSVLLLLKVVAPEIVNGLVLPLLHDLDGSLEEHAGAHWVSRRWVVVNRVPGRKRILLDGLIELVVIHYNIMYVPFLLLHRNKFLIDQWVYRVALHRHLGLLPSLPFALGLCGRGLALDAHVVEG